HDDMTLAPCDLLVAVVAARTAYFRSLDGLCVDAAGAGRGVAPLLLPHGLTQGIDEALPGAVVAPKGEVIVDGALGEQVMRQHVPLAAGAVLIEQSVQDFAHLDLPRPPARFGRWNQGSQEIPLGVGQVGRVRLAHGLAPGARTLTNPPQLQKGYGDSGFPDRL